MLNTKSTEKINHRLRCRRDSTNDSRDLNTYYVPDPRGPIRGLAYRVSDRLIVEKLETIRNA